MCCSATSIIVSLTDALLYAKLLYACLLCALAKDYWTSSQMYNNANSCQRYDAASVTVLDTRQHILRARSLDV